MAEFFDALSEKHVAMIAAQPVFFVATAAEGSRINLSPKGYDAFRVLSPSRVAWLDLGGSGNETNAHLLADGRITIMFCNFQQPAQILRIYGKGEPVLPWESGWDELAQHFTLLPGTRQIFDIAVESVQTSCGYGVPLMSLEKERQTLIKHHTQSDPQEWAGKYKRRRESIDGLPARTTDRYIAGETPDASS
ncbi:pyridoxamine 5'-phosphate oxidase family protein [Alteraurantiacibacter aquimixticola]|uniref:Pyridoxamine 5'-phosphate oxidase family protein n=1 Tax=Alteraurantiacibacter aquimixticola TaxID=2489173 RepID=A0A4T3EXL1_9SPHN|nr:pyridoxamine 5'-phosphate oxidase family protein [Alteraurantiacibacter aquimixticola]TIX49263.1 pyridoxamine 5'-phosphate oxidase family protein [Alteraurantiacibacter aquimixticola]